MIQPGSMSYRRSDDMAALSGDFAVYQIIPGQILAEWGNDMTLFLFEYFGLIGGVMPVHLQLLCGMILFVNLTSNRS
jgi:hypothetical protein